MPTAKDHRRLQLSRTSLTALLLCVMAFPPATIAVLYATLPPAHDEPLKVATRLVESEERRQLTVSNESSTTIRHVRVEINRAFHYLPQDPIHPADSITIPLEWFAKKSGERFRPTAEITGVRITARLPSQARGVFESSLPER